MTTGASETDGSNAIVTQLSSVLGSNTKGNTTVLVRLLDEGTEVYRPVDAVRVGENTYVLLATVGYAPDDETWEFVPGSHVRCELRDFGGVGEPVAMELVVSVSHRSDADDRPR